MTRFGTIMLCALPLLASSAAAEDLIEPGICGSTRLRRSIYQLFGRLPKLHRLLLVIGVNFTKRQFAGIN
jgi:hypothetical protein